MPYINNVQDIGFYVPTTNVWDIARINDIDVTSPDFKALLVSMYQNINKISVSLNTRDNGYYMTKELIDNQQWFNVDNSTINAQFRQNFRKVIVFPPLPVAGTLSVPHGIAVDANLSWTKIYGAATDPIALTGIPLPFVSTTSGEIQLDVDAVNVNISVGSDYSNFTVNYIILEYLKN